MSGPGIALATRGIICKSTGIPVVTSLVPDAQPSVLEPDVLATDKGAPKVSIDASDLPASAADIHDTLAPQLNVAHTAPPVPDAKPKKTTKTPSAKVRPLEDLAPTIVDKKD